MSHTAAAGAELIIGARWAEVAAALDRVITRLDTIEARLDHISETLDMIAALLAASRA